MPVLIATNGTAPNWKGRQDGAGVVTLNPESITSSLYDGGGTSKALQAKTTGALLVASGAEVIDVGYNNVIDVWLCNSTASQSCTLRVAEFSAETPTVATQIRDIEVSVTTTDQTATVDRAAFGLTTGTEYAPKAIQSVSVTPGSYVMIALSASSGGTWYARYQLRGSV